MDNFHRYLITLNLPHYEDLIVKFALYHNFLAQRNKEINLTAIKESEYYEKHFHDSLLLSELYLFSDETLLDIGSGAGFPGLVLALVYPKLKVTLLEPTKKRANFLIEVSKLLNLHNVQVVSERAEDYIKEARETFDIVTARAVANMQILLELSAPFAKVDGVLLVMKGQHAYRELSAATNAINVLNLRVTKEKSHHLLSDNAVRINFQITKTKQTKLEYPRNYAQIKKKPL